MVISRAWLPLAGSGPSFPTEDLLASWMGDPSGRLLLLVIFLTLLLLSLLLILVPLLRRRSNLLLRRLTTWVERIRLGERSEDFSTAELNEEERALVRSLERLLGEMLERARGLEEDRLRLESILNAPADVGILATDGEGHVRFVSRAASALLGYSPGDLVGRSVEVLFPEESWNDIVPRLARRSLRESGLTLRTEILRKDRSRLSIALSIVPASVPGDSSRFVALLRDASAESSREQQLEEAEERLKSLMQAIQEAVLIVGEGRILYANAQAEELLGRPRSELAGRSFKEAVAPEDLLMSLYRVERALSQGGPEEFAARLIPTAGTSHPREVRIRLTRIESKSGRTLLATLRDESEGRRMEQVFEASRSLLDATLDSTSDGILVQESSGGNRVTILVNRSLETLLGVPGREILSWSEDRLLEELVARGAPGETLRNLAAPHANDSDTSVVLDLTSPSPRSLEVTCTPLVMPGEARKGRVFSFRDISARRATERALRESHEALATSQKRLEHTVADLEATRKDLAKRNEELEKLNRELRSLDEMKSSLLANVSHELQTPLVLIKGYTEMILKRKIGPLTPEQEKGLSVALKNIDRLVEMIDNLLDFSRMERGESPLDLEEFPLWQAIDEVVELVREKLKEKGLSLTTEYATDDLMVRADRGKILQVLINLLSNAIKFNREGGRIGIRVSAGERGSLGVEIRDTGIGIPSEERDRIFERFYQVDASPGRRADGTGIGLAIVRDILALHGSSIRVESQVGEGTRFFFTLPLGRAPSPPRPADGRSRSSRPEGLGQPQRR